MNHRPRKRFGQHFLTDPNIVHKIIGSIAPVPGDQLVEIGPGLGALTVPLLDEADSVNVIELDRDVIPRLRERCNHHPGLRIHQGDVLEFDLSTLHQGEGRGLRIIGNLPYNISTAVLFHLLQYRHIIIDMHFMLQKEVVDRIAARPGSHAYGRLSVMLQTWFETSPLFDVAAGCFSPPPKVESSVIRLVPTPRYSGRVIDSEHYALLVRQAFAQRRKTLRNTLRSLCDSADIVAAGIDPSIRAEQLAIDDFLRLHETVMKKA